jgi:hypothetical protein
MSRANDSFRSINSDASIGAFQTNDFIKTCYQQYKKEYANDEDFSLKSSNISQEVDELLNEFDYHVKQRHDIVSNSIYSDLLEQIGIDLLI